MVQPQAIYSPADAPRSTPSPTAQQVVDGWAAAAQLGYGTVLDAPERTTVGGKPAVSLTVRIDKPLKGMIGCEFEYDAAPDCGTVPAGRTVRVTAVDTGDPLPTVFLLMRNTANPGSSTIAADLDAVVGSVVWG
jgi:hypothetical protein